ncbi:hypothetical protein DDQ41_28385 [Streptomyces spongiicola]|uniref:Uncharacterized protein n=1 Tax=Streptomyces spongiicola TaxID=1690221 RepID=A0ABN5KVB2_9ACTN|nr:hypothetical protein [Streptomyces spongiicola]AWK12186.1 hypothetical protein DDQ41_28385 [Streptomyces spongiicola]
MSAQLRETAVELADVLWREHTVYRDRAGGVVIRGEHVRRWISLAPSGGRDELLLRAGRILDGGTTAPARSEAVVSGGAATAELAAVCRRLLAEAAADPLPCTVPSAGAPSARPGRFSLRSGGAGPRTARTARTARPARPARGGRPARASRSGRHTGLGSWAVIVCVAATVALYAWSAAAWYR